MGSLHRLFGGPALAGDWDWWGLLLSLLPSPPSSCKAGLGVGGRPKPDERVGPPPPSWSGSTLKPVSLFFLLSLSLCLGSLSSLAHRFCSDGEEGDCQS